MARRGDREDRAVDRRQAGDAAFRKHLTTYLVSALFFVALNAVTSFGDWWFYWPIFFWGWAVLFQAVSTYGSEAPARVLAILRDLIPGVGGSPGRVASRPALSAAPSRGAGNLRPGESSVADTADAEARVARLWRVARQIPGEPARDRAFRVCVAADRVAEALAQDNADPELVGWFIERHLAPAEALLDRYARVARRGVEGVETALSRVEEHDLPLIETRLESLYQQLHRGDVIDLAVASEMLELEDVGDRPPTPSRRIST